MLTAIHLKGPKTLKNQIDLPAFGRTRIPVQSLSNTIVNFLICFEDTPPYALVLLTHRQQHDSRYVKFEIFNGPFPD